MKTICEIPEIKLMSAPGLHFLANEEGCILRPYKDAVGIPTIGIGCTYYDDGTRVKMTDPPITMERALLLFKNVLTHYEKTVWTSTRDDINQHQFDALTCICFNIGVGAFKGSTLLRRVNLNPGDPTIKDAFLMWRNAGKRPILLARRIREAALYFTQP
jgi:lysozyme